MDSLDAGNPGEAIEVVGVGADGDARVDIGGLEEHILLADGASYARGEGLDTGDRGACRCALRPRGGGLGPSDGCGHRVELEHDAHLLRALRQGEALQTSRALR